MSETEKTYSVAEGSLEKLKAALEEKHIYFRLTGVSTIAFDVKGIAFIARYWQREMTVQVLHKPWYISYDAIWSTLDKLVEQEAKP